MELLKLFVFFSVHVFLTAHSEPETINLMEFFGITDADYLKSPQNYTDNLMHFRRMKESLIDEIAIQNQLKIIANYSLKYDRGIESFKKAIEAGEVQQKKYAELIAHSEMRCEKFRNKIGQKLKQKFGKHINGLY